ncbi:beta-barrel assembly-enhancing protease [mine drainage metagenome]|uniref:Beta-barrel assembly-enhancing protease n=1 Tax=mine drainage metagenome TaxID=410659 RepID=A0A1J5R3Z4_9ZZZZ
MTSGKVGRNDPCPCGSGKKYKQCCQDKSASPAKPKALDVELQVRRGLQLAWGQRQQGDLTSAQKLCGQVLQLRPGQPDALHLLGAIALHEGRVEDAIGLIAKAIRKHPANPEYYNNLGLAYHEQGKLELAMDQYRKAIALAPRYPDAYFNLHALLLNDGNQAPAIECLQQLIAISPADLDAHLVLGALLEAAGRHGLAAPHLERVGGGAEVFKARLDAWRYMHAANLELPMTGSLIQTFRRCMDAAPADGLVLEFGVRNGNSIRQIASLARQVVHGFDSFEGLPEVWHHEPKGSYTTAGVIPRVPANVQLHVGWFEATLPKFLAETDGPVRFVNVDCDIYSSTRTVLDLLAPRIQAGSVLVFDEYIGNAHWREDEFRAFQEAVEKYRWKYEYLCYSLFTKQVAVVIRQC